MGLWKSGVGMILLAACLVIPGKACGEVSHVHGQQCRDAFGQVLCGYGDFVVHEHGEICYYGNGDIRCELPRIPEHIHGAGCYESVSRVFHGVQVEQRVLVCQQPQVLLHTHTSVCFQNGALICGMLQVTEHRHFASCFGNPGEPVPGKNRSVYILTGLLQAAAAGLCLFLDKKLPKTEKCLPQR